MRKQIVMVLSLISALLISACSGSEDSDTVNDTTSGVIQDSTSEERFTTSESATSEPVTDDSSYVPKGETPQAIKDVIFNDAEYICVFEEDAVEDIGIQTKTFKMSEFNYWNGEFRDDIIPLGTYRVVDLDNDGYNEVICEAYVEQLLVFHYEDEQVYGFIFPFRAMSEISRDGVIHGSSAASAGDEYRIDFDKATYTQTIVSQMKDGEYYVEGENVSMDEYMEYVNEVLFKEMVPVWRDYLMME